MPSFDVVSKLDMHELDNAVQQASREVGTRYDFRGSDTSIERNAEGIQLKSDTKARLDSALSVLREKVAKRGVSLKSLDTQPAQEGGGSSFRQLIKLKEGVDKDAAKEIVKRLKGTKLKVQASIQGDSVRVTGKKRDDLQEAIAFLKGEDLDLPLSYTNFRD